MRKNYPNGGGADLARWGVDKREWYRGNVESKTKELSEMRYEPMYYEPQRIPKLKLSDCVDTKKYDAKMKALKDMGLPEKTLELLRLFAYRFIKIDFEGVANYYAFQATEKEKQAIERLRLVLVDDGSLGGFIEDNLIRIADEIKQYALKNENE